MNQLSPITIPIRNTQFMQWEKELYVPMMLKGSTNAVTHKSARAKFTTNMFPTVFSFWQNQQHVEYTFSSLQNWELGGSSGMIQRLYVAYE
jgi:hypothetical protein